MKSITKIILLAVVFFALTGCAEFRNFAKETKWYYYTLTHNTVNTDPFVVSRQFDKANFEYSKTHP